MGMMETGLLMTKMTKKMPMMMTLVSLHRWIGHPSRVRPPLRGSTVSSNRHHCSH